MGNENRGYVITIARQHGTGGIKVGKRLAEELGILCYDSEMFKMVSNGRISDSTKASMEDGAKDTVFYDTAMESYDKEKSLFEYQSDVIRGLAEKGPCIIVGRCANDILRDNPDCVRVFIHAPIEYRVKRMSYMMSGSDLEIKEALLRDDKRKAEYYKNNTGREWTDIREYDMVLNSSILGIQKCADEIKAYIDEKFGE